MRCLLPLWLILAMVGTLPALSQDATPPEEPPSEDDDRITFNVALSDESGAGRVEGWAGEFEYQEKEYFLASGGVRLTYRDLQLQADRVRIDIPADLMTAEGSVVLDEGPRRLVGDSLEYNLSTRTGKVTNATAYVDSGYVFKGDEIAKVDAETYTLDNGVFTSCSEDNPSWSINMGHAEITLENYARIKNARMKFGKVPVLYVPYMVWPTKTERSSGLLVPQPGFSTRRGFELSLGYYKTLGRSADTTFFADLSSEEYFGFGNEFRYHPTENTEGHLEGYLIQDQDFKRIRTFPLDGVLPPGFDEDDLPEETRWKLEWFHETRDLWGGFRGVINVQDYSDPTYRLDFERNVGRQTNNFIYSQAYLTRNFGQQSLNLMVDLRERIQTGRFVDPDPEEANDEGRRVGRITDTRRQLPEIEYRLRPTQLGGTPIYFSVDANVHYLSIENNSVSLKDADDNLEAEEYGRGDIFPSFSIPLSTLPWLSAKIDLGARWTHYTRTLDPTTGKFDQEDDSLTRTFGVGGAEIVGPSFSRIFDKKKPGRFSKFKHVVEPRVDYAFVDDFEDVPLMDEVFTDQDEVPLFDEIDDRRLRNEATLSLINRILAKPSDEDAGGAFEILSFEISRAFSYDDEKTLQVGLGQDGNLERTKAGPLRTILRFNPSRETSLKAEARYNTINSQLQSLSVSGGFKAGRHTFGGSLFKNWNPRNREVTSNQLRVSTSLSFIPERLRFDANLSFDLKDEDPTAMEGISNPLQQRYFLSYTGSCYTLQFEFRESQFNNIDDRDFRFTFTLKNVGTFIDLNGSLN